MNNLEILEAYLEVERIQAFLEYAYFSQWAKLDSFLKS